MHEPIGCAEAVRRLWDFLEHDLDAADQQAVEDHLAWCRRCCGELAFAREMQRMLRTRTSARLPADVEERLTRTIDELGGTTGEGVPT
jgi:anti-sigma factor (TIGR02949 family)